MGATVARGYGGRHQAERAAYAKRIQAGLQIICACQRLDCPHHRGRCQVVIKKGMAWDLGHDDADRTRYTGPECVPCNRSAGARASNKPVIQSMPVVRPATASRW